MENALRFIKAAITNNIDNTDNDKFMIVCVIIRYHLFIVHYQISSALALLFSIYFGNLALHVILHLFILLFATEFIINKILIMDAILDSIPQLIKDIEQLEDFKAEKENERQLLESQNQKLRYRLKLLKEVSITYDIT